MVSHLVVSSFSSLLIIVTYVQLINITTLLLNDMIDAKDPLAKGLFLQFIV